MTEPDHIARLRAFRQYKDSFATDELKDALALLDDYDALAARLAEAEALLQEVYDGRQSLMSVGLVYRIGHTLNHRPADSATHRENERD